MGTRFDARVGRGLVWLSGTVGVAVIGLAAAVVFIRWSTLLIVFLTAASVVGTVHLSIALGVESLTGKLLVEVLRWSSRAGLAVLAVCGFGASVGLATLPLVGLVAATLPLALTQSDPAPGQDDTPAPNVARPILPSDLAALTDQELCVAWRHSYLSVCNSQDVEARQAAVEERQRYLDELERRSPDAFARWLETMPRAAGDPARYYLSP